MIMSEKVFVAIAMEIWNVIFAMYGVLWNFALRNILVYAIQLLQVLACAGAFQLAICSCVAFEGCIFLWLLTAQNQRSEEMQTTMGAQQEKITSLGAELQSTNQALGELSLAKETAVKEKVSGLVYWSK